jgi:hypothetical protein
MIRISIDDHIDQMLVPNLFNWRKAKLLINNSSNDILQIAHTSVETKLSFAHMHLTILSQVYEHPNSFEATFMKRAMFENTVINLVSSLEAAAHVINQIYNLGIEYKQVILDHKYYTSPEKHQQTSRYCLRCKLNDVNSSLASYLNKVLKRGSPVELWYEALREYRHQIVHRPHFIAHVHAGVQGYFLPDDPRIIRSKERMRFDEEKMTIIIPNYTKWRELMEFSECSFLSVLQIIDEIYALILDDENIKEGLNKYIHL